MKKTLDQTHHFVVSVVMLGFMSIAPTGVFTFLEFGTSLGRLAAWGTGLATARPLATGPDLIIEGPVTALAGQISKAIRPRGTASRS